MDPHGSITQWIAELKLGDVQEAQQELWNRYFRRLVGLARLRLGDAPRVAEDEEDVALSALRSFFCGMAEGRFPRLDDRHNLWSLLAKMTAFKAINQRKRQLAQKRGGGAVRRESDFDLLAGTDDQPRRLAELIEEELTPDLIAAVNEQCQVLMKRLPDEKFRLIACRKLMGFTNAEIAAEVGVVERTIERKLEIIRSTWLAEE